MDQKDKIKNRLKKKLKEKEQQKEQLEETKEKKENVDNLKIFQAINEFIGDINSGYGDLDNMTELKAYDMLLSKTTLKHKNAIDNHVKIFRNYCKLNEKIIKDKNEEKVENIKYNDKITINLKHIFSIADKTDKVNIWKHLLILLYYTNPSVELKSFIQNLNAQKDDNESKFLENMVDKL